MWSTKSATTAMKRIISIQAKPSEARRPCRRKMPVRAPGSGRYRCHGARSARRSRLLARIGAREQAGGEHLAGHRLDQRGPPGGGAGSAGLAQREELEGITM